jgi:RNase P subunit RPR2
MCIELPTPKRMGCHTCGRVVLPRDLEVRTIWDENAWVIRYRCWRCAKQARVRATWMKRCAENGGTHVSVSG